MTNSQATTSRSPSSTSGYGVAHSHTLSFSHFITHAMTCFNYLTNKNHQSLKFALVSYMLIQLYGYLHTQPTWGTHSDYLHVQSPKVVVSTISVRPRLSSSSTQLLSLPIGRDSFPNTSFPVSVVPSVVSETTIVNNFIGASLADFQDVSFARPWPFF